MQQRLSCLVILAHGLVWFGLMTVRPSLACSCLRTSPTMARQRADVVLTGKVILRQHATPVGDRPPLLTWTFLVDQVSKGRAPRRVQIYSSSSTASCGVNFQIGADYRIYAQRQHQILFTHLCAGNEAIAKEKQQPN